VVLPQTTLGQISIAPWTDQPTAREKEEKKRKLNKQQQNKKDTYQRGEAH
jgi:hypothetical protein